MTDARLAMISDADEQRRIRSAPATAAFASSDVGHFSSPGLKKCHPLAARSATKDAGSVPNELGHDSHRAVFSSNFVVSERSRLAAPCVRPLNEQRAPDARQRRPRARPSNWSELRVAHVWQLAGGACLGGSSNPLHSQWALDSSIEVRNLGVHDIFSITKCVTLSDQSLTKRAPSTEHAC